MKKALTLSLFAVMFVTVGCSENMLTSSTDNSTAAMKAAVAERGGPPAVGGQTIVEIAAGNPDFSILVDAVKFAGLVDVLNGRRQFTVFAPTNAAFIDLLDALGITAAELFTEENKELVKSILLYHVAPGERFAKDVVSSSRVSTLLKEFLMVKLEDGTATIGNDKNGYATIIATDIDASNGVIHVVDQVLLQPSY